MSKINIAVLVGSLRRDSFNARLAAAVAKLGLPNSLSRPYRSATFRFTIRTMMEIKRLR